MGSLKPGATYIYERANGVTYSREAGQAPEERKAVGWDYIVNQATFDRSIHSGDERNGKWQALREEENKKWQALRENDKLWEQIRAEANTNLTLQKALDRAIMIYRLSKDNPV